jgi:hypothetical protein
MQAKKMGIFWYLAVVLEVGACLAPRTAFSGQGADSIANPANGTHNPGWVNSFW